jgi:hypothetical protein
MDIAKSCTNEERIELSANKGITPHIPLEAHETVNGFLCELAFGMEKCRTVIALYHGNCSARLQELAELFQCLPWFGKMFKHETDEDMIKSPLSEREMKNISLTESNIANTFFINHPLCSPEGIR